MTLAHDSDGTGPTVLLVHAGVCDRRMWAPQVGALREAGFRVCRPDLPGFGDSPATTADPADTLLDLVEALGPDPVHLVGASYGGGVALDVAARRPERVRSLLLVCANADLPADRDDPDAAAEVLAFGEAEQSLLDAGDVEAAVALNVRTWVGPQADADTREFVATMQRDLFRLQATQQPEAAGSDEPGPDPVDPARVTARSLVLSGAHDLRYFTVVADWLAERIPDAARRHLDWAGHLPSLESPDRFTPLLVDHLRS
jgi:3-oxoadipate enol-lactonase